MRVICLILASAALSACSSRAVVQDRPVIVGKPVAIPCLSGERPAKPLSLNEAYTAAEWGALDLVQKAAVVSVQALDRLAYGEQLAAATGGCR